MPTESREGSALYGLRVLDLAGEASALCGKLLADLGADVLLVEPPGGNVLRHRPPYVQDQPGPENSLSHLHYHTSKRGITADLDAPSGQDRFRQLVAGADVVLDANPPGWLAERGIDYPDVKHSGLIWASVTPYGLSGPRAGWLGNDLTLGAAGGFIRGMGADGDPLFRPGGQQAYHTAAQQAVIAILTALLWRERTGIGQRIDISIAECVAAVCALMAAGYAVDGSDQSRTVRPDSPLIPPGNGPFECLDGAVIAGGGPIPARHWPEFIEWMNSDGLATDWVGDPRWLDVGFRTAHRDEVNALMRQFFRRYTKAELCAGSIGRGFMLFPLQHAGDLFNDPQLRERGFFQPVPDPDRNLTLDYPGPPYRLSASPARIYGPAPCLSGARAADNWPEPHTFGRHTADAEPVPAAGTARPLALTGLRVIELGWYIAGPLAGKILADQGAEVLKIESALRPDPARYVGPFPPDVPLPERTLEMATWFSLFNSSVKSIALNLADPRGLDLLRGLVAQADVLIENFAPGTMERWGLDYAGAAALKPDIIMVRMPLVGSAGPRAGLSGGGNHLTGFSGLQYLTGLEDGEPSPVGPRGIYPDYGPNPLHAVIAVLAALNRRSQTGKGQEIELAQFESMVTVNGTALLEYAANASVEGRMGNRSRWAAPHNIYRCRDTNELDGWCAIAVETDDQWNALAHVIGPDTLAANARLRDVAGRKAAEDDIDREIERWTAARDVDEVVETLQAAGVMASRVAGPVDLLRDPQLAHREQYRYLPHPAMDRLPLNRLGFRFEKLGMGPLTSSPLLGQHTDESLASVLGLSADEIAALHTEGVLA